MFDLPGAESFPSRCWMSLRRRCDLVTHGSELRGGFFWKCSAGGAGLSASPRGSFSVDSSPPGIEGVELTVDNEELGNVFEVGAEARPAGRQVQGRHAVWFAVSCLGQEMSERCPLTVHLDMRVRHPLGVVEVLETEDRGGVDLGDNPSFDLSIARNSDVASRRHRKSMRSQASRRSLANRGTPPCLSVCPAGVRRARMPFVVSSMAGD
jgi:hypothetical protein